MVAPMTRTVVVAKIAFLCLCVLVEKKVEGFTAGPNVVVVNNKRRKVDAFPTSFSFPTTLTATVAKKNDVPSSSPAASNNKGDKEFVNLVEDNGRIILDLMQQLQNEAVEYADSFGLSPSTEGAFFALFHAIYKSDFVRQKIPFVLRYQQVQEIWKESNVVEWPGFFTMSHLEKALEDDFLDAARGSTDNRKGWQITDVSVPRGNSFEEARMTYQDVQTALDKGTVIFNAAGAHIPVLAGPTLACCDATYLPCALNLYITAAHKRTSAPPHTDKQDVVVIQSTGCKHWNVYSPPDPADKPQSEMFARGKMTDSLPLYLLESDLGCQKLLETTLYPGDVLFIPAAFPHTTSTVLPTSSANTPAAAEAALQDTSVHLTMGLDHHIWELDYLSVRRLALRRAGVADTALGRMKDEENPYTGASNELPAETRDALFAELPLGLLNTMVEEEASESMMDQVARDVERISRAVDETTASQVPSEVWRETVERVRQQGIELYDVHRDMYLAALEEGREREAEEAMTAHLDDAANKYKRKVMTPQRMQRLSLFRVKRFFDEIEKSKNALREWSYSGGGPRTTTTTTTTDNADHGATVGASAPKQQQQQQLPSNWAFTMPVRVGDQVEADLGGAFFAATVKRAVNNAIFDVEFFDGDRETNLSRSQIKLLVPPALPNDNDNDDGGVDTSQMTPKQLRRWKKQQDKLKKKQQKNKK